MCETCENCIEWDNTTTYQETEYTRSMGRCEVLEHVLYISVSTSPAGQQTSVDFIFTKMDFKCNSWKPAMREVRLRDLNEWNNLLKGIDHSVNSTIVLRKRASRAIEALRNKILSKIK